MSGIQGFDAKFTDLINGGALSTTNSLRTCLPSSLDLTANCLATYDLSNSTVLAETEYSKRLQQIYAGLQGAVPSSYREASFLDFNSYWTVLLQNTNTINVTRTAADDCITQKRLIFPPSAVDFSRNCTASGVFWNKYKSYYDTFLCEHAWQDDAYLMRESLDSTYDKYSDWALYTTAIPLLQSSSGVSELRDAASKCPREVCQTLGFIGNSDIAGTGAVVAYIIIAVLATLMSMYGLYGELFSPDRSSALHTAWLATAFNFWDTTLFFSIMISVASTVYIETRAATIYELLMASFSAFLASNASFVLLYLGGCGTQEDRGDEKFRFIAWVCAWLVNSFANGGALVRLWSHYSIFQDSRVHDAVCYEDRRWPLVLGRVASAGSAVQIAATCIAWTMTPVVKKIVRRSASSRPGQLLGKMLNKIERLEETKPIFSGGVMIFYIEMSALFLMWFNLIAFLVVREAAFTIYGPSFVDNGMGYGQIVATGFCLQTVMLFLYRMYSERELHCFQ